MFAIIRNVSLISGAPLISNPTIVRTFIRKEDAEKSLAFFKANSNLSDAYSLYDSTKDNPHYTGNE